MTSWTHWLRSLRTSSGARRGSGDPARPRMQQRRFRRRHLPLELESLEARNLFTVKALSLPATGTITDDHLGTATAMATTAATVTAIDKLAGTAASINATAGTPFSGSVAFFTDTNTNASPDFFTATIDWGDGTTSAGVVSGAGGNLTVSGTHTYTASGSNTLTVTLHDNPNNATATAVGSALVAANAGTDPNQAIATGAGHNSTAVNITVASQQGSQTSLSTTNLPTPALPIATPPTTPALTIPTPPTTPVLLIPPTPVTGLVSNTPFLPVNHASSNTGTETTNPNLTLPDGSGSGTPPAIDKGTRFGDPKGSGKGDPGSLSPKSDTKGKATDILGADFAPAGSEGRAVGKVAAALLGIGLWTKFARDEETNNHLRRAAGPTGE
jgi:hypothetical protein